jgi:4-hydroxybenzoate polyprenyltransferase
MNHVPGRPLALNLVLSLRPGQWTKNLLVFAGLLFGNASVGRGLFDGPTLVRATAAFVIFCALSGVVYLVNDITDRESDRQHPIKAKRPIASGALSVAVAIASAIVIGGGALAGAALMLALSATLGV